MTGKYENLMLLTLAEISGVNEFLLLDYFYDKNCKTSKHFKELWESRKK